jgi:hypothetical protein
LFSLSDIIRTAYEKGHSIMQGFRLNIEYSPLTVRGRTSSLFDYHSKWRSFEKQS